MKKIFLIFVLFAIIFNAFSQEVYKIYSYRLLTLDKKVQVKNGEGYYSNGMEKQKTGVIKIFKDKLEINFGSGDPDFVGSIYKKEINKDNITYLCKSEFKEFKLIVFEGIIYGLTKTHSVQLYFDFDNTLKLWSYIYFLKTSTELSNKELNDIEQRKKNELAIKERQKFIEDSIVENTYPKIISKKEINEVFFIKKNKKGDLKIYWINEDKQVQSFEGMYEYLKKGLRSYVDFKDLNIDEDLKIEVEKQLNNKTEGEYYISIVISQMKEEVSKANYREEKTFSINKFEK